MVLVAGRAESFGKGRPEKGRGRVRKAIGCKSMEVRTMESEGAGRVQ